MKKYNINDWKGMDIIGRGGFGITDFKSYMKRGDVKKTIKKLKKSELWLRINKKNP